MIPAASDGAPARTRVTPYAWYVLGVLVLVYMFSFIDRQILAILAESIRRDLGLNDAQLGFLYGTAFAIFYALFGMPLGRMADGWRRNWIIAIGLLGWSLMTSFSGLATSFAFLAIARVGVGLGEASASPCAFSLISDYFPQERRSTAFSIYSSGLYLGLGLSLPIGGFLLAYWARLFPDPTLSPFGLAPWQATFIAVGLPGLLLALLVLTIRDPRPAELQSSHPLRDLGQELMSILPPLTLISTARLPGELKWNLLALALSAAAAAGLSVTVGDPVQWIAYFTGVYAVFSWVQALRHRDRGTYRLIWATPATALLVAAFGSIAAIAYSSMFWAAPYALRTFYDGPTSVGVLFPGITAAEEVSSLVGWSTALASAVGVIAGGVVADRWRRRDVRGRLFAIGAVLVLSAPLVAWMFTTDSLVLFYVLTPLATGVSSGWLGAGVATVQDLVLPRMRGTVAATLTLGITMVGLALGPYLTGKVSTITGSIPAGVLVLYLVTPLTLLILWRASRVLGALEASRAERAGEADPAAA